VTPALDRAAPLPAIDTWRLRGDRHEFTVDARTGIRAEPYLRGHFPGYPIFPGVFVLEAVCQAVAAAFGELGWDGPAPQVSTVRSLRFLAPLLPGDTMALTVAAVSANQISWRVTAEARRSGGTVAARVRAVFGGVPAAAQPIAVPAATAGSGWEYERIHRTMPHRHPFLLVDRVLDVRAGTIRAAKAVSASDPCYQWLGDGVTAGSTAYPVSLLVESLGQAAVLLWLDGDGSIDPDGVLLFVGARDYRVHGRAVPGDVVEHVVTLESTVADTVIATGESRVGGRLIATAGSLIATRRGQSRLATAPHHGGRPRQVPLAAGTRQTQEYENG
jgi:3-hydroxymyristoyl/3-hydroxydecanoyl-(acyl carrier protein) dehydratase